MQFLFCHLIIWDLIYSGFPLVNVHLGLKYLQRLEHLRCPATNIFPQTISSLVFSPIPSKSLTICQTTGYAYESTAFFYSRLGGLSDVPLQILPPGFGSPLSFSVTPIWVGSGVAVYFPVVPAHCANTPVKQAQVLSSSVSWSHGSPRRPSAGTKGRK